jgi:Uncharacterised protein conserved in bacteria (DUF2313)
MPADLAQYLPRFYDGCYEMEQITGAEDHLIDEFFNVELGLLQDNQYVSTADARTITAYEKMLGIAADPSAEPLDFRRERLINRLSMRVPFTMRFLRARMDALIGKGRYTVAMDYPAYTLTVEASAVDQNWNHEIRIMINRIKPANIIYKNVPLVMDDIFLSDTIQTVRYEWNYRAGTTARTSLTAPMGTLGAQAEVLGVNIMTVQNELLDRIAGFTLGEIDNVLINDSYVVPAGAITESREGSELQIEYVIPPDSGLSAVTNIKLRDAAGKTLTNAPVYFIVTDNVTVKHNMQVKEGV